MAEYLEGIELPSHDLATILEEEIDRNLKLLSSPHTQKDPGLGSRIDKLYQTSAKLLMNQGYAKELVQALDAYRVYGNNLAVVTHLYRAEKSLGIESLNHRMQEDPVIGALVQASRSIRLRKPNILPILRRMDPTYARLLRDVLDIEELRQSQRVEDSRANADRLFGISA